MMCHDFLPPNRWRWAPLAVAVWLSGCATLDPPARWAPLQQAAQQHLGASLPTTDSDDPAQAAEVAQQRTQLLGQPLSAASAVQLALLGHPGLSAQLQALALADAQRVQASRLPNPRLGLTRLQRAGEQELEAGLFLDVGHWLGLPWTRRAAEHQLAYTQQQLTLAVLDHAAQTRRAYFQAVAAGQQVQQLRQLHAASHAGAELARRMAQAGNFNALQQAREQALAQQAQLQLWQAEQAQFSAREALAQWLGLADTAYTLPTELPPLPPTLNDAPTAPDQRLAQRLDVQASQQAAQASAAALGWDSSRLASMLGSLELGLLRHSADDAALQTGLELSLELPLWDWSGATQARVQALHRQRLYQAAAQLHSARSEQRQTEQRRRSAWQVAKLYQDQLLPNAQRIADESLLRYNGMLIGVFELLADARAQHANQQAGLEALRDFWLAQVDWEQAQLGPLSAGAARTESAAPSAGRTAPNSAAH